MDLVRQSIRTESEGGFGFRELNEK